MTYLLKVANDAHASYVQSSIEKQAFLEGLASPEIMHTLAGAAHHIGFGVAAHIGSNAAIKAFRAKAGNRVLQSLGELGVKHGLEGKEVHPFLMDRIKQVVGPEAVAEYSSSKNLLQKGIKATGMTGVDHNMQNTMTSDVGGKSLYERGRDLAHAGVRKYLGLNSNTNFANYPIMGNVQKSTDSFFAGKPGLTQHTGLGGRIINGGMKMLDRASVPMGTTTGLANRKVRDVANVGLAAASMAVPGLGDHVAINSIRDLATRLPLGSDAVKTRIMQGVQHETPVKMFGKFGPKVVEGKGFLGKTRKALGDYLYSPTAWSEARDFGVRAKKDGFTEESIKKVLPLVGESM